MAEVLFTHNDANEGRVIELAGGEPHKLILQKRNLTLLELEDVNFHHNSAVMMPDYGVDEFGDVGDTDNDGSGTDDQAELAGLSAIAATLRFAKCEPTFKLLVVGHTDTSGQDAYNLELSQLRAKNALSILCNLRDDWVSVCQEKSKTEDYQQILKWIHATRMWGCDPGEVDDDHGPDTDAAVEAFQESYNAWEDDSRKHSGDIDVDGDVGEQTWGAIFDVYQDTLEELFEVEDEGSLQEYREALLFLDDANKFIGCGEQKPIDEPEQENYKSETNRRVEMLFFAPDDLPTTPLACHPSETECKPDDCPIYWKYRRKYMPADACTIPRSSMRIHLCMGKVEDLFPTGPSTAEGRMARLQTVGLFYFPLGHSRARTAFDGLAPTAANASTGHPGDMAFPGAWDYYKSEVIAGKTVAAPASDAEADADLQKRLEEWVLDQGTLPEAIEAGATPDEAKNFRKLRTPGGFTMVDGIGTGLNLNRDTSYAMGMEDHQNLIEQRYFDDNEVLGKIPLVAKVEQKNRRTGAWEPLKGATVYFQLLPSDPLPAYDPSRPCNAQINRPHLRDSHAGGPADPARTIRGRAVPAEPAITAQASGVGPAKRYVDEEARNLNAADPQGRNCPSDRGGKRGTGNLADGTDVADVIFECSSRKGFNEAHADRELPHKPYPVAERATPDGDKHKHAVKAKTNEDGEAGVIFLPARMGGDRYKLRAYLGPPSWPSDGSEEDSAVAHTTGTFVVWRSVRLSRYFQLNPTSVNPTLLAEVNNAATYNITSANRYLRRVGAQNATPLNAGNWSAVEGSPAPNFAGPMVMWARAWCEFTIERNALGSGGSPRIITDAEHLAVRRQCLADAIANQSTFGANYDMAALLYLESGAPTISASSAVAAIPMRTPEAYNATRSSGDTMPARPDGSGGTTHGTSDTHRSRVYSIINKIMWRSVVRALSNNGFMPGFCVVQTPIGATWQIYGEARSFSGIATNFRGSHVWYGSAIYITSVQIPTAIPTPSGVTPVRPRFSYSYDSNMIHEMGHAHHREHGPGRNPNRTPAGGNDQTKHDSIQTSVCVMSYKSCEGDFCGRCTIGLRGWDIRPMTP